MLEVDIQRSYIIQKFNPLIFNKEIIQKPAQFYLRSNHVANYILLGENPTTLSKYIFSIGI